MEGPCVVAVLEARGDKSAESVTLLAAMLDFGDPGELSVFVDEAYVQQREQDFAQGGVLRGKELGLTFSSLRANDLIWNNVINNYLKGGKPDAFMDAGACRRLAQASRQGLAKRITQEQAGK